MVEVEEKMEVVVSVTKKGQATIPKKLRKKYGIKDKVLFEDEGNRIVLKPLPTPAEAFGCLKYLFPDKTAKQLVEEGRKQDYERDKRLLRLVGSPDV